MQQTWDVTTQWREHTVEWLKKRHPAWTVHGQKWTSWYDSIIHTLTQ
jgi:hypothetical protein